MKSSILGLLGLAILLLVGGTLILIFVYRRNTKKKTGKAIKQPIISSEQEYVICPNCGAGYNTQMVISSILMKSPFMADMSSWTTKIICSSCRSEFGVSGSYNKVFGQPRTS